MLDALDRFCENLTMYGQRGAGSWIGMCRGQGRSDVKIGEQYSDGIDL